MDDTPARGQPGQPQRSHEVTALLAGDLYDDPGFDNDGFMRMVLQRSLDDHGLAAAGEPGITFGGPADENMIRGSATVACAVIVMTSPEVPGDAPLGAVRQAFEEVMHDGTVP
jgi:hypothetical protein